MTFKEEFSMESSAALKQLKDISTPKEWIRHFLIYLLRVVLLIGFCIIFVIIFQKLFGKNNAIAGVAVLLMLLTFRKVHLGYNIYESLGTIFIISVIYAFAPYFAYSLGAYIGFIINLISIFLLLVLGCDNINFFNHAILVLSYLLLYGNPVTGRDFYLRIIAFFVSAVFLIIIFLYYHRNKKLDRRLHHVITDFSLKSKKNIWQIYMAIAISLGILVGSYLGLERTMWIGIAIMSVLTPFEDGRKERMKDRVIGTIIGCILFSLFSAVVPEQYYALLGIAGGVGVSFTTSYRWKTVFNGLGALSIAMAIFGKNYSIFLRLADNIFAILFILIFNIVIGFIGDKIFKNKNEN